jgi:hypothetical protein
MEPDKFTNTAPISIANDLKNLSFINGDGIDLAAEISKEVQKTQTAKTKTLFLVKSANEFINDSKKREVPECLYDYCWYQNEISILFADSNLGKSIFAVQIANEIAKVKRVLLFDFELSGKQFEGRYSNNYQNHYIFPENFLRAEIDPDSDFEGFTSFEDYVMFSIKQIVIQEGIKILIIDNITYLKNETDKAKYALPLMKLLKQLQRELCLSILVLAHTPKRDMTKPLTQNDLSGSKMIMNFCDSAFAIGASQKDPGIRYLKQIKTREVEAKYTSENVKLFQIVKPDNYLFMEFVGFSTEREHLKVITEKDREEIKLKAKELQANGWGQRSISKELGIALGTVNKYINS